MNGDETSWKIQGKRCWLWIATTPKSVFFKIDPSRSAKAFGRVFGNNFNKLLTTDRYAAYNDHQGERQICLGHIDRDFEKIEGRGNFDGAVGEYLKTEMDGVFNLRHGVLWRKISFGNQSESGKVFVQRMLTVVMTLKKQAQNALDYLRLMSE